jgi:hypothetical protein
MTNSSAPLPSPTRLYARLLRELHTLIAAGNGDSEAADALRDQMDAPWEGLTEREQDRLGGLSEDLYALTQGGARPVVRSPAEDARWRQELSEALQEKDCDRALALLRQPPSDVPPGAIASLQARCWESLGDPETALLFLRQAERLNPQHASLALSFAYQIEPTLAPVLGPPV